MINGFVPLIGKDRAPSYCVGSRNFRVVAGTRETLQKTFSPERKDNGRRMPEFSGEFTRNFFQLGGVTLTEELVERGVGIVSIMWAQIGLRSKKTKPIT